MAETLLRAADVARRTGLSVSTIERLVRRSEFPAPIRVAGRSVRWLASEVAAWIDENVAKTRGGTSAPAVKV